VASAKTRWMTRPWCSGELRECQLGKAALGSGCSGVDERRTGETGMGRRLGGALQREKRGVGVGTFAWKQETEERQALARRSAARDGRQWPLTVGRG
jgi:hypothetical protein